MSEIPEGYIAVPESAWHELVQYELKCQELAATVEALREVMQSLSNSHKNNSGYEPSLSVFWRNVDEASKVLNKTPQQHLAEIRAQAAIKGWWACWEWVDSDDRDKLTLIPAADQYAESILKGEVNK